MPCILVVFLTISLTFLLMPQYVLVTAKNQSKILTNIDNRETTLFYRTWMKPNFKEDGEWFGEASYGCEIEDATNVIVVESTDTNIPQNFFFRYPNVERFEMTKQRIQSIKPSDWINAKFLLRLNVSHNEIADIAAYAFAMAPKLIEIDLSHNRLTTLNVSVFDSYLIEYLYLHSNRLVALEPLWFENLLYLRVLTLNNNFIRAIDLTVLEFLPNLNVLRLQENQLVEIKSNDQMPRFLKIFDMSENPLPESKQTIMIDAEYVNLRGVNASSCQIGRLMKVFIVSNNNIRKIIVDDLTPTQNALIKLNLAHNNLQSIENLTIFRKLEYLDLSFNLLTEVQHSVFGAMKRLTKLNLGNNRLKKFEAIPSQFQSLIYLDVSCNDILSIQLAGLVSQLKVLRIEGNHFETVESSDHLNLRKSSLSSRNEQIFDKCISPMLTFPDNADDIEQTIRISKDDSIENEKMSNNKQMMPENCDFIAHERFFKLITDQLEVMERNMLLLIDAKFNDVYQRLRRLEQEMAQLTSE